MTHRLICSTLALGAIVALSACSKGNSGPPDSGPTVCTTLADCSGNQVCLNSTCVNICHATSECQTAATPNNVCEEGVCLSPACGNDSQCGGGQSCINGACRTSAAASQVQSCDVTPAPGAVRVGSTLQLKAVTHDADGNPLKFSGVTWAATSGGSIDANGLLTASGAGDITVTATAGSKTCNSTVHSYAAPAASNLRVTAINMHTKEPIAGAKVVLCDHLGACAGTALTTGSDGTVSTTSFDATGNDVHVFAAGYNYTSFIGTTSTDLLVALGPYVPIAQRSGFTSHMCDSHTGDSNCPSPQGEFAPLQDQGEAVHLAFFGSGVPNSLLDLSVDTLVGPSHTVHLSLPGTSTAKDLNLPYGLVLGIGTNFFGTNDPRYFADPGVRSLWGIGGNVNLAKVVTIISPLLSGTGDPDIGALLPQLLGFFGRLEAGAVVGVKAPANGATPTFANQPVQLTTPMRLRVDATSPDLPKLDGHYVDGVLAVVGAMNYPMGFVPLGLTAGLADIENNAATGKVLDPTCDTTTGGNAPCATNKLPLKFAPENGGTEGSDIAVALLALNFGGLQPGSSTRVALSGQVAVIPYADVKYVPPNGTFPAVTPPAFMNLPASNSVQVTKGTRNVTINGDADTVSIYRFELENAARQNWNLWVPKMGSAVATRSIHLPNPHDFDSSLVDPFQDAQADDGSTHGPSARLLAMQLNGSPTPDALQSFTGSLHLDELGAALKAFTALQVDVSP